MNYHVPTPTEAAAIERHRKFHADIATRAANLKRSEMTAQAKKLALSRHSCAPKAPEPESFPAETDPPIVGLPDFYRGAQFPLIDDIILATAWHFKVNPLHLASDIRTADVMLPRHMAMYLARELTPFSLSKIARKFRKDHTCVHYACNKIELTRAKDATIAHHIAVLTSLIQDRVNARDF